MKNMNAKMKKWLAVTGCLALCAVLVVLIGQQFITPKPVDNSPPPQSSEASDMTVAPKVPESTEKEVTVTPPDTTQPTNIDNGAVSSGTGQTIQGDAIKPEYTEEQLKDPTQKPTGGKVTEPPKPVDHNKVEKPKDNPVVPPKQSGGLPGFDNVPNAGANQGEYVDGDGDINKQVGTMD